MRRIASIKPERSTTASSPHVAVFDGLRGLAILMVIAAHSHAIADGGRLGKAFAAGISGVQLFFIVSAVTLMYATTKRNDLELGPFAVRRLARIAPLYFLGMAFYLAVPIMPNQEHHPIGIGLNVFFIHAFVPQFQNNVVPGGWSIGCEMAFYAIFPLIFLWINSARRALVLLAAAYVVDVSLIAVGHVRGWSMELAPGIYYHPAFQLPAFATGIVLYQLSKNGKPAESWAKWAFHALSLIGFFGIVALYVFGSRHASTLLPVSACVGVLVYGCIVAPPAWMTSGPMVRLGLISFSVYIWHFAILFGLMPRLPIPGVHSLGTRDAVAASS